jgi:hypothetical protein
MAKLMIMLLGLSAVLCLIPCTLSAATFTVTNTNDSGAGSLRDAMLQAEANKPFADTILFNIPGTQAHTIYPLSQLPSLTDTMGVFIDGLSQPGASDGREPPRTATIKIEIHGAQAGPAHGLHVKSAYNKIQGLAITMFDKNGIFIEGIPTSPQSSCNTIRCNFIGMHHLGLSGSGNGVDLIQPWAGVYMDAPPSGGEATVNQIVDNLISSNYACGAYCGPAAWNNTISGNYIGTDKNGQNDYGNIRCGVVIDGGASYNWVYGNIISGNDGDGISVIGDPTFPPAWSSSNTIEGNLIGIARDRTALPNGMCGVSLGVYGIWYYAGYASSCPVFDNTIAFNLGHGVRVWASDGAIYSNSIYENVGLGIDLDDDGVTPNDPGDTDAGANTLLNFPVIDSVHVCAGVATVWGSIDIDFPPDSAVVQLFKARLDPTGYGEGETYLGSAFPDAAGNWSANVTGIALGDSVTATTTVWGNTSEFSACVEGTMGPAGVKTSDPEASCLDLAVVGKNPYHSSVLIRYSVPEAGPTTLRVYSVTGRLVRTLVAGDRQRGDYLATWDGKAQDGRRPASGLYLLRLEAGGQARTEKIVLLR